MEYLTQEQKEALKAFIEGLTCTTEEAEALTLTWLVEQGIENAEDVVAEGNWVTDPKRKSNNPYICAIFPPLCW